MQQKFITRRDAIKTIGGISLTTILGNFSFCSIQQKPDVNITVIKRVNVSLNPDRNFHSVSACMAPNGDFLVNHQDSLR
ncbi:MAG: hypothetical protein KAU83_04105, partial [Bacteroidales bacterium]|nr:hypothetical protein [Bacteroidales bacterium]